MAAANPIFSHAGATFYFQSKRANWNPNLTSHLVKFISDTKKSLDIAVYDLRDPEVLYAIKSKSRTAKIRLVYDGTTKKSPPGVDPKPNTTAVAIKNAGIDHLATPVKESGIHIMHDKFMIRDNTYVWTGSANFTTGGLQLQDNNCLEINSSKIASVYQKAFDDLQSKGHSHSPTNKTVIDSKPIPVGDMTFTTYFAPGSKEAIEDQIVSILSHAKKVRILCFVMTDPGILESLTHFEPKNMDIRGIYDKGGFASPFVKKSIAKNPDKYWFLKDSRFVQAPSHPFDPKKKEQDFMHNKTMIIDNDTVITGSYNFSENAEANDENVLVIKSRPVTSAYLQYFDTLYSKYK